MSDSQTSFATLGSPIGTIIQISGSVLVKSIDGNERVVKLGDSVFYGETVVTGSAGSVTIQFVDGSNVVIGGDSVVSLDDEVYTPADVGDLAQDSVTDAEALQQAIADGADPTLIQDAPAAGEDANGIGEQQRVDVNVDRNQEGALPSYGFDTDHSVALPSFGYDTNNRFSSFLSGDETNSVSTRDQDSSADTDNNLSISLNQTDQTVNKIGSGGVAVNLGGVDADATQVSIAFSDGTTSVTTNAVKNSAGDWVVPETDISALKDGSIVVTATVTDSTGNTAAAVTNLDLDTSADSDDTALSVSVANSDTIVGAAEAGSVSVTLDGVDSDAETVT
ncbi:retention module-containing protein, partial [Marinomonas flavescens]|uniref:retention module-containing protein n=1 Tax=Marinomonas flavescens TaxID=2529379 RepID=UPI001056B7F1